MINADKQGNAEKGSGRFVHGSRSNVRQMRAAFTLIELLVVIAIIALVAAIILTGLNRASKSAKRSASQRSAAALAQAVEQFKNEFGFLPPLVHDGPALSGDDDEYRPTPLDPASTTPIDGPVVERSLSYGPNEGQDNVSDFQSVVIWNEGLDYNFFRRRSGSGLDPIELSGAGEWDEDAAWDDRRYSKYSLAYYLTGVLDRNVDGVRGPGFARPIIDGSFLGVGYPVGSSRDRFEPFMDVDRRGVRVEIEYIEPKEFAEHDSSIDGADLPERDSLYGEYEDYQLSALTALVDGFGNAYRYYRWEPGRFVDGQLVIENTLDLNLPPVLIDPIVLAVLQNDADEAELYDLTDGNLKLRDARYAVVSAGPDGMFGTESIETIAAFLRTDVPASIEEIAELRHEVWRDNAVEVGQ